MVGVVLQVYANEWPGWTPRLGHDWHCCDFGVCVCVCSDGLQQMSGGELGYCSQVSSHLTLTSICV